MTDTGPCTAPPCAPCAPCPPCEALLSAANLAVLRALEFAGKRLITRATRGEMLPKPEWTRHTYITVSPSDLDRLLDGVWTLLDEAIPDEIGLSDVLDRYVRELLLAGQEHDRRYLQVALAQAGYGPEAGAVLVHQGAAEPSS